MKQITILETSDYEKLTPKMLELYLEKYGWEKMLDGRFCEFWKLDAYSNEVLVPVSRFSNFAETIGNAIKVISETYHKDEVDVFNEILELGKEEIAGLISVQRREFIQWLADNERVFDKFEVTLGEQTVKFQYPDGSRMFLTDYFNAIDFADKSIYDQPF